MKTDKAIKTYEPVCEGGSWESTYAKMVERDNGQWVLKSHYDTAYEQLEQKLAAQEREIQILKSIDVFCASGMTQIQFADKKWCINQGETWRPQLTKESK